MASPGGLGPIELDKVCRVCLAMDAELELFHCIYNPGISLPGRFTRRSAQEGIRGLVRWRRQQLERTAERFRQRGLRVTTSIRWDYPAHEGIVRQVLRHKPRLLIAQSSRRGRLERLLTTGIDYKLIEVCPCPVLFIKTGRPYSDPVIVAAVEPDRSAGLDEQILESAGAISDALSGRLLVFQAREGSVAESLPRFVDQEKADVVVMGVSSRLPFLRALLGHTAERVLDALDCDAWIVKAPGFRCPVSRHPHHLSRTFLSELGKAWP